jgi:hypothetical protein
VIVSQFEYSKSRRMMSCQRKLASRTAFMDSGFRRNDSLMKMRHYQIRCKQGHFFVFCSAEKKKQE